MLQEVLVYQRAVVESETGDTGTRQVGQLIGMTSAIVEMQTSISRPAFDAPARRSRSSDPRVGQRRPRKRLKGDEQPLLGESIGVGAQRLRRVLQRFLGVEPEISAEFAGTDLAAPERVGDRFDAGQ